MQTNDTITLLITRHGFVYNPDDILYYRHVNVPLSKEGHIQMQEVGAKIKDQGIKPDYLYTSTLLRAVQSSKEIAKSFPGIVIIKDENLQDPYAPGIQEKTLTWLKKVEAQGFDVYSHPDLIDVIEPREDVGKRMKNVIDAIREKHMGKTVIIVSHGDTIALLKEKLKNPNKPLPSITDLKREKKYPSKGEVLRVVLSSDGIVLEETIIC